jgi:lysophospholipase L1-like esterase
MKLLLSALIVTVIASAFTYGVCVGKYKLPPYYSIKRIIKTFDTQAQEYSTIYLDRTSFFDRNGKQADVAMVGDSITCRAEWQELLEGISVINRGIDGDTTSGILNRTGSIFSAKPKVIFFMAGINDIAQRTPPAALVKNIEEFITESRRHRIPVVVQSILLTSDTDSYAGYNEKVTKANAMLADMCRKQGIVYTDINTSLDNYSADQLNPAYTHDGIHLNGEGYARWAKTVAGLIVSLNDKKRDTAIDR